MGDGAGKQPDLGSRGRHPVGSCPSPPSPDTPLLTADSIVARARQQLLNHVQLWTDRLNRLPLSVRLPHHITRQLMEDIRQQARGATSVASLKQAQSGWHLLRLISDQRSDPDLGVVIQVAELCAEEGLNALKRQVPGLRGLAAPLVVVEPTSGPMIWPQGSRIHGGGTLSGTGVSTIRVPIIMMPPELLDHPWLLTSVQHELGHTIVRELDLVDQANRALRNLQPEGRAWAEELLCDALAIRLTGGAYVDSLRDIIDAYGGPEAFPGSKKYPAAADRLAINCRLAARWDTHCHTPVAPPADSLPTDVLDAIVDTLCTLPFGSSDLDSLSIDAPPRNEPMEITNLRAIEPQGWRALAALGQRAIESGCSMDDVRTWAAEAASRLDRPSDALTDADWAHVRAHLQERARSMREPDGAKSGVSVLLTSADEVALVGATHRTLPNELERAFDQRGGRRWSRIEVFMMDDETLDSLRASGSKVSPAERDAVRDHLIEKLPNLCDQWAVYQYGGTTAFASYWDWQSPGGRIHMSYPLWGTSLSTAPAVDFAWVVGEASQDYVAAARALDVLREGADCVGFNTSFAIPIWSESD